MRETLWAWIGALLVGTFISVLVNVVSWMK